MTMWIILGGAAAFAGWYFFLRKKAPAAAVPGKFRTPEELLAASLPKGLLSDPGSEGYSLQKGAATGAQICVDKATGKLVPLSRCR
jgi:hypothetical protein